MEKILNRLQWIDFAKGFVMILVVIGHVIFSDSKLRGFIFIFHMPFFFVMAGYLLNTEKWEGGGGRFSEFKSKLEQRLLLPYFAANFAWYPIWFIVSYHLGYLIYVEFWGLREPIGAFVGILVGSNYSENFRILLSQLWFLPCLFFAELIFLKIHILFRKSRFNFFIMIFLLSYLGCTLEKIFWLPLGIDISLTALIFIFTGNLIRKYNFTDKLNFGTCIIIFIILLAAWHFNTFIDMNNRKYGNFVLFYINGIVGTLLVMKFSILATSFKNKFNDLISYCGVQSMIILVLHIPILGVVRDVAIWIVKPQKVGRLFSTPELIFVEIICGVLIPLYIAKRFSKAPVIKYFCA